MQISINANRCEPSPMRKFHPYAVEAEKKGKKIYHLNIGQPDLPTPTAYYDAVRNFDRKTLAYAESPGMPVLIDAVRGYYHKLGVDLAPNDVLITTGGSEALLMTCLSILDPYTEVIIPEPYYPNYTTFVHAAGGVIRALPTNPWEGYRYAKRERIESLITKNTRAILITNPGNPTGLVLTHEEMRVIADVVKEHDLFLVADEVYREFIYDDEPMGTFCEMEDIKDHVIVVDSISKRFSACGARIGSIISRNREFMAEAMKLCQGRLCTATLDQAGAAAMYEHVQPSYFKEVRDEYKKRRDAVVEELNKIPGTKFHTPDGAFYMMVTLPVDDVEKLQYFLLEEFEDNGDTVMYAPGSGFYADPADGRSEIRIAYVHNCDYLRRAIQLLGKGIAAYNAKRGA